MPNGRPGDSRWHDIVHLRIDTYGPSCDALIREIAPHLPRSHAHEFREIVESWPWEQDGSGPRDTDRLFQLLLDWRARVDTLPPDPPEPAAEQPATVAPPPASASPANRAGRAFLRFVLGAVVCGLVSFFGGLTLVPMPSGDAAMGTAIGIFFFSVVAAISGGVLAAVFLGRR